MILDGAHLNRRLITVCCCMTQGNLGRRFGTFGMILDGDHLDRRLITACCCMTCTSLAHLACRMAERYGTGKTRCSFLETDFRSSVRHLCTRFGSRSVSLCSIPVDSEDWSLYLEELTAALCCEVLVGRCSVRLCVLASAVARSLHVRSRSTAHTCNRSSWDV